jgi:hypothetical protein
MDIEKLVERECKYRNEDSKLGEHDKAYEYNLRKVHANWGSVKDRHQIQLALDNARWFYAKGGNTHENTAACVYLYTLLEELKNENL